MKRFWLSWFLPIALAILTGHNAFAQEPTVTAEQAQAMNAPRVAQEKAQADAVTNGLKVRAIDDGFPNRNAVLSVPSPGSVVQMTAQSVQAFRADIPRFREATTQYRWMLGQDGKLDKPLRLLETQVDALLFLFKASNKRHPLQNPDEFKSYSKAELRWEALNSAEHIDAILDIIAKLQEQDVVSLQTQELQYGFYGELLRLKWLTAHIR